MRIPFGLKLFCLIALSSLLLVACERPVPNSNSGDPAPTLPPSLPQVTSTPELQVPAPETGSETTDGSESTDSGYPAPSGETEGATGEGEATTEDINGNEPSSGTEPSDTQAVTNDGASSYIVQPGDTLFSIATQYNLTIEELAVANNITDANALSIGDTLTIPTAGTVVTGGEQGGDQSSNQLSGQEQVHIVQAGENLYRIGLRYGFTVNELATYNNLANPNSLAIGQEIRIPAQ